MKAWKKYWVWPVAILLMGMFWWMRFSDIRTSFFFFNDMGRDSLVLWDWKATGKPPLLGPQASAMPMNQSAVYYYMLYPLFLMFGGATVSALYTNALLYIVCFVAGLVLLKNHNKLRVALLVSFFLATIHPQYIIQNRFVWNPSFIPPLLSVSFISLYLLTEKFNLRRLMVFSISMALAVAIHFPAGPFMLAAMTYMALFWKKNRVYSILVLIGFLIFFNLPSLVFEARHDLLITKSLFSHQWIGTQQFTIVQNIDRLANFTFSLENKTIDLFLLVTVLIYGIFVFIKKPKEFEGMLGFLFVFSFLVTIASKMAFHSHYIFGFTTLIFLLISGLPKNFKWMVIVVFVLVYLNPNVTKQYFVTAPRTVEQMEQCFAKVCGEIKDPIFVSTQAGFHSFHNGPEHRFLMKKAGCNVKYVEDPSQIANLMAVVLDDSNYVQGATNYNELTLFGKSKEIKRFTCQDNFGVVILERD